MIVLGLVGLIAILAACSNKPDSSLQSCGCGAKHKFKCGNGFDRRGGAAGGGGARRAAAAGHLLLAVAIALLLLGIRRLIALGLAVIKRIMGG